MKNIIYLLILTIVSCSPSVKESEQPFKLAATPDSLIPKIVKAVNREKSTTPISSSDLEQKIFEIGSKTHFTDTCSFFFECDCCSGILIFNDSSTFYYKDYCMSDQSLRPGYYNILEDTISLEFDERCISRVYNYENEMDTSAIDFFIRDTILNPLTIKYLTYKCNGKIKMIEIDESESTEIGIETDLNYLEEIEYLISEKLIKQGK